MCRYTFLVFIAFAGCSSNSGTEPPSPEIPATAGQGVRTFGDGRTLALTQTDNGTVWGSRSYLTNYHFYGVPVSGAPLGPATLTDSIFISPVVSQGNQLGWLSSTTLYSGVVISDATGLFVFSTLHRREVSCTHLIELESQWVGICTPDAAVAALSGSMEQALIWFSPGTLLPKHAIALGPGTTFLQSLGDSFVVQYSGSSRTPEVHGIRGANSGRRLEHYDAEGGLLSSAWSPVRLAIDSIIELSNQDILMTVSHNGDFPGTDATGPEQHSLATFRGDSAQWQLPFSNEITPFAAPIAAYGDGFLMATASDGIDFGGDVGVVNGVSGPVLAMVTYDACGVAKEVKSYDCGACTSLTRQKLGVGDLLVTSGNTAAIAGDFSGTYDLGAEPLFGGNDGLIAVVATPAPPETCSTPPEAIARPQIEVQIIGQGQVELGGTTCTESCTVEAVRFAELAVTLSPADGFVVAQVSGACTELPCLVHADAFTQGVRVEFREPDGFYIPTNSQIGLLAGGDSLVFGAGYATSSVVATVDGMAMSDGQSANGFLFVLDVNGLVTKLSVPGRPLAVIADGDVGYALTSSAVYRFSAAGLLATTSVPAGNWTTLAMDGLGTLALGGGGITFNEIGALDGSWYHRVGVTSSFRRRIVGRAAGGFALAGESGGRVIPEVGPQLSGSVNDLALLSVDSAGLLSSVNLVDYRVQPMLDFWEHNGALWLSTTTPSIPLPSAGVYAERLSSVGVAEFGIAFPHAKQVLRTSTGYLTTGDLASRENPFGGARLLHRGETDVLLAFTNFDGSLLWTAAMGSALRDFPFARTALSDGTVFLSTSVDVSVQTPFAIGVFSAP